MGLALIAASALYAYEVFHARPRMAYLGVPRATDWKQPRTWTHVLRNHGFMLGYSELRGNPLWVTFALRQAAHTGATHRRPGHFSADWRNLTRISPEDYTRSGYDRGHMAPNHAMDLLFSRPGQLDSFLMTNVVPQKPELNRKLWERLEEAEFDHFARLFDPVWVVTGPLFDARTERLKSAFRVEIPDAFFRIYAAPGASSEPRLLAFVMPQDAPGNAPLDRFLTSVDTIEALSGLDFFHELEDAEEERLEAAIAADPWGPQEVARLPGRFASKHRRQTPASSSTEP